MKDKIIIIVGTNSIHTHRFIIALLPIIKNLIFITNKPSQKNDFNIPHHDIDFSLSNIMASRQIGKILKQYSNENLIIHIHQANSYAFHTIRAIKKYNIQCTITLTAWGSDILLLPNRNFLFKQMVKYNLSNVDIITSGSLYVTSKIYELLGNKKNTVKTINFGVDEVPSCIDLSQKEYIILSNRLHKSLYNIDKIIIAFAKIKHTNRLINHKLIIAGDGILTDTLKNLAKSLQIKQDEIIFTGMLNHSDLINWYKKAQLFISVPNSDACAISLLEAMMYGCVPIVSNIPANLECVINNINGIINQNLDELDNDILRAINIANNSQEYMQLVELNQSIVKQKGTLKDNIGLFYQKSVDNTQ